MEPEKSKPIITTKPAAQTAAGKTETTDEERAALIKPGKLPSYLQRRGTTTDEEEKKEKELLKSPASFKNSIVIQTKK